MAQPFSGDPIRRHRTKDSISELIPAWEIGTPQTPDSDYLRFSQQGYEQNSLIYSCIQYRAASFASVPLVLERVTNEGVIDVLNHPAVSLLANPSEWMDWDEFARLMVTHLMVAGNAYIHKNRDVVAGRRRVGQVTSLGLIRPDYVEIVPGATRAEDIFEVKIGGIVRARIPRSELIHIKFPHPTNDFYGLSPIETLVREGSIDLHLSDFELSFFRNAGVPYGLLKTKRHMTGEQREQAKGAFRRAFSGFRNWFDLLIINTDEAEYQQLGLNNSDMEMGNTRDFVESRIAAALGVPAVIAGALVGLKNSPWSNMPNAYRKFWSDSQIPLAKMIEGPLNRELLPELIGSSDALRLRFDFSGIDALQEDNTEKLKTAATLIQTGGVTVHDAFQAVGMEPPEDSDFYVQPTQVQTPEQQAPETRTLSRKRKDALQDAAERRTGMLQSVTSMLTELTNEFEPVVASALERQGQRVVQRYAELVAVRSGGVPAVIKQPNIDPDDLLTAEEEALLREAFAEWEERAVSSGWAFASGALSVSGGFDEANPFVQDALSRSGALIRDINETTRQQIAGHLQEAHARGYSIQQIANGVPQDAFPGLGEIQAFSRSRARTIARTEMANAQGYGAAARYRAAEDDGLAILIEIADGDDCGWLSHDDPDKADGKVVTIQEFEDHTIAHPNCVRAPIPRVQS